MSVVVTKDSIIIKKYYFPLGNSREIKFKDIKKVTREKYSFLTCKSWGGTFNSAGYFTWWNRMMFRESSGPGECLIIYTSSCPAAGITPLNIDEVEAQLRAGIESIAR